MVYMQYARRESGWYSGKIGDADTLGVDTAYRLLADHIRMIAVTNAPGSQLGKLIMFRLGTHVNNYNINVSAVYFFCHEHMNNIIVSHF
jgi:hypothetical protein